MTVKLIVYGSTTNVVQIMTMGWPWPILRQGQILSHRFFYGKKWKLSFFGNYCSLGSQSCLKHSINIGFCMGKNENYLFFGIYCSLRSQRCFKHLAKWVNEVERVSKVKVILWSWSKVTQISKLKLVFHRNSWAIWNQSSYESLNENGNENLYKWVGSHDKHDHNAQIW